LADAALAAGDPAACAAAAQAYGGDLLPGSPYEPWAEAARSRLRARYLELLRAGAQWERVVEGDPADAPAHRELMRRALAGRHPLVLPPSARPAALARRAPGPGDRGALRRMRGRPAHGAAGLRRQAGRADHGSLLAGHAAGGAPRRPGRARPGRHRQVGLLR